MLCVVSMEVLLPVRLNKDPAVSVMQCCVLSGQWGEPGGLFEDTPMPEVPLAQDVGEGSSAVGKPEGWFRHFFPISLFCVAVFLV